jgi:hypothetical protein
MQLGNGMRRLATGAVISGAVVAAAMVQTVPAAAKSNDLNIPKNIRYNYPECAKQGNANNWVCTGTYWVNKSNYKFTEDALGACPANGTKEEISLGYFQGTPANGGLLSWANVTPG